MIRDLKHETTSLRKPPIQITSEIYDDGFLRVEHNNFYVECGGMYPKFSQGEFLIISLLTRKAHQYVNAETIWKYIWHESRPFNPESLRVIISNLRRKLKPFRIKIETMVNTGYRLISSSKL